MPFYEPENPNDHDLNHDIRRSFGLEGTTTLPPIVALTSSLNIVTTNTPTLAIINSPAAVIDNSPSTAMDTSLSTLPFLPFFYTSLSSVSDISFSSAMDTSFETPAICSSSSPSLGPLISLAFGNILKNIPSNMGEYGEISQVGVLRASKNPRATMVGVSL